MIRRLPLVLPFVLLLACGEDADGTSPVVASVDDGVVQPESLGPPLPGPLNPCLVLTPAFPAPGAGDLDTGFGCAGVASVSDPLRDIIVKAIAVQADDKIVAVGDAYNPQTNHHDAWAARFTSAGKLDPTFATGGIFTKSFTPLGGPTAADAVVVQPSGALVLGGGFYSEGSQNGVGQTAFLLRLLPDGTLDPSFGSGGVVQTTSMTWVHALRLQDGGGLVAAGETCTVTTCQGAIGRFAGDTGAPLAPFGSGGFVTTNLGGSAPASAYAVAVSGSDAIVAGRTTSGTETNAALARYGATGLVASFGSGGNATYDTADVERATGIANHGTGFVFTEALTQGSNDDFMLVRIQPNGTPYTTFGFLGRFIVGFAGYGAQARGLVVTPNGQIVAVGSARTSTGHDRLAVARVNGNGTLDTTFSDDGFTMLSTGADDAWATSVALQSTGRIIAAGWSRNAGSSAKKRAVLVRLRNN
jgi:uncharacterized delta-60 repeat protein